MANGQLEKLNKIEVYADRQKSYFIYPFKYTGTVNEVKSKLCRAEGGRFVDKNEIDVTDTLGENSCKSKPSNHDSESVDENKTGQIESSYKCSVLIHKNEFKQDKLMTMQTYKPKRSYDVTMSGVEIYLFPNQIGFYCYELSCDFNKKVPVKVDETVDGQTENVENGAKYTIVQRNIIMANEYIKCLDNLALLNRKIYKVPNQNGKIRLLDIIDKDLEFDTTGIVGIDCEKLRYGYSFKKEKMNDKAITLTYTVVKSKFVEDPAMYLSFFLVGAKNSSYMPPEDLSDISFKPFGNVTIGANRDGFSYVADMNLCGANDYIVKKGKLSKNFKEAYLWLYLQLLNQSYGLIYYSHLVTTKFPVEKLFDGDTDTVETKAYIQKFNKEYKEINKFLLQGISATIGGYYHMQQIYKFTREKLCVEDDIESLTLGLDSCATILDRLSKEIDQKEQERQSAKIEMIGLLAIISALADAFGTSESGVDFVRQFFEHKSCGVNTSSIWFWVANLIINVILLVLVYNWSKPALHRYFMVGKLQKQKNKNK